MRIPIISNWIDKQIEQKIKEQKDLLTSFSEQSRDIILQDDELLSAMAKQRVLLLRQNRKPIAIFISEKTFDMIISKIAIPIIYDKIYSSIEKIKEGRIPVTDIAKIPVYVNPLLKDAMLFVVGAIVWKSFNNGEENG